MSRMVHMVRIVLHSTVLCRHLTYRQSRFRQERTRFAHVVVSVAVWFLLTASVPHAALADGWCASVRHVVQPSLPRGAQHALVSLGSSSPLPQPSGAFQLAASLPQPPSLQRASSAQSSGAQAVPPEAPLSMRIWYICTCLSRVLLSSLHIFPGTLQCGLETVLGL